MFCVRLCSKLMTWTRMASLAMKTLRSSCSAMMETINQIIMFIICFFFFEYIYCSSEQISKLMRIRRFSTIHYWGLSMRIENGDWVLRIEDYGYNLRIRDRVWGLWKFGESIYILLWIEKTNCSGLYKFFIV